MTKQQEIKRAQRESYYFREISNLFLKITIDEQSLLGLHITKVNLSPDGGSCIVLFLDESGKEEFEKKLATLILYKPSMRSALAKMSQGRYTPNLIFRYDDNYEKVEKINRLIDTLKKEGRL